MKDERRWMNVEIIAGNGAEKFRSFLKKGGYKYEPSACFNYIHFEVYINKKEELEINDFLHHLATN